MCSQVQPRKSPNGRKRNSSRALHEPADRAGAVFFSWEASSVRRCCWTKDRWLWKCSMNLQLCSCFMVRSLKLCREEHPQLGWVRIPATFGESQQGVLGILQNNGNPTNAKGSNAFFLTYDTFNLWWTVKIQYIPISSHPSPSSSAHAVRHSHHL